MERASHQPGRQTPDLAGPEADALRSAALPKELRLTDLVLTQVLYVVGSSWVGTAARLGRAQIVFWLLAIVLFYVPQAAVVIALNRSMPLEGGLYQWAKTGLSARWGFLVAWNLWVYTLVLISAYALGIATTLSYALGPGAAQLATSKAYDVIIAVALVVGMMLVSLLGLRIGKWVHNLGGVTQLITFAALLAVPFFARAHGMRLHDAPLAPAFPVLSLFSLNILGKLGMGALSGFEWVAIFAGEARNPGRTIGRSVLVATPLIAAMFILGTSAVLAIVGSEHVDLISPIPQTLTAGYGSFGFAAYVAPALVGLLFIRQVANVSLVFAGNTRLPMVAGWDGLLPAWFTTLHPRYRTPLNSILFAGVLTLAFTLASLVGVGQQEAFQALDNAAGLLYALTYLVMFALPLVAARRIGQGIAPLWLRAAAVSGFGMTLLYVVFSIVPIVDVVSRTAFAAKIIGTIVGVNLVGLGVLAWAGRWRSASQVSAE